MKGLVPKVTLFLKRNSSTILTVIGAIGVVGTTVTAVRATPKALRLLEEETNNKGEPLTNIEIVQIAAPTYIPTILVGGSTIGCIFGANILNTRQQAALTSAYALMDHTYKEYKNKVNELYGGDADVRIREEIAKDKLREADITVTSDKALFFDEYSGRFFESTIKEVQDAEYHLNRNFALRGYCCLNEFYEFLGQPVTEYGATVGWSLDAGEMFYGYSWIDFEHRLVKSEDADPDYREFYQICMPFGPTADYEDPDF